MIRSARKDEDAIKKDNVKNFDSTLNNGLYRVRRRVSQKAKDIDAKIQSAKELKKRVNNQQKILLNSQITSLRRQLRLENKRLIKEANSKKNIKFETLFKHN